jgi:hypothetical protein
MLAILESLYVGKSLMIRDANCERTLLIISYFSRSWGISEIHALGKRLEVTVVFVLISLVVSAVICFGDAAFASDKPKFTKHFYESLLNITDNGLFSVEILLNDKEYPKLGKDVIGLVIHDEYDKDVEGADIKITATPEGRAGAGVPVIKDKGDGLYTVSNISLKKGGKWEFRIGIRKAGLQDSASFLFPDVLNAPLHKGKSSAD